MPLSLANPARPRAIRVVGLDQATSPAIVAGASQGVTRAPHASSTRETLERLVRAEPAQALRVLEDWLDDGDHHVSA